MTIKGYYYYYYSDRLLPAPTWIVFIGLWLFASCPDLSPGVQLCLCLASTVLPCRCLTLYCLTILNKTANGSNLLWLLVTNMSPLYYIAFSSDKVNSSESREKYAQIKYHLQARTVLMKKQSRVIWVLMAWWWVNILQIFIFGWTIPVHQIFFYINCSAINWEWCSSSYFGFIWTKYENFSSFHAACFWHWPLLSPAGILFFGCLVIVWMGLPYLWLQLHGQH